MILGHDEPALSAKGHLIPPLAGKPVNTYGWALSVNLGQYDLDRAVVSPENMRYFASAMYLSKWHWASGAARNEPEKDDFNPVGICTVLGTIQKADDKQIKAYQKTFGKDVDWPSSGSDGEGSDPFDIFESSHHSPVDSSGDELYERGSRREGLL